MTLCNYFTGNDALCVDVGYKGHRGGGFFFFFFQRPISARFCIVPSSIFISFRLCRQALELMDELVDILSPSPFGTSIGLAKFLNCWDVTVLRRLIGPDYKE